MVNFLQDFKDQSARAAFGMTAAEAHEQGVCIMCRKTPVLRTALEKREYEISGLGGPCWDKIFSDSS